MNILLINNGTIRLKELQSLLQGQKTTTIKVGEIDQVKTQKFDLIILSGSSDHAVVGNGSFYKKEIELIKKSDRPIIGICLGFELICHSFGARLCRLDKKEKGIIDIQTVNPDGIFDNLPNFQVYEAHRWSIKTAPAGFVELARSDDGVEAVKHETKPIYGFQFHPEMFTQKTCGDEIFNNLIKKISQI